MLIFLYFIQYQKAQCFNIYLQFPYFKMKNTSLCSGLCFVRQIAFYGNSLRKFQRAAHNSPIYTVFIRYRCQNQILRRTNILLVLQTTVITILQMKRNLTV